MENGCCVMIFFYHHDLIYTMFCENTSDNMIFFYLLAQKSFLRPEFEWGCQVVPTRGCFDKRCSKKAGIAPAFTCSISGRTMRKPLPERMPDGMPGQSASVTVSPASARRIFAKRTASPPAMTSRWTITSSGTLRQTLAKFQIYLIPSETRTSATP